MEKRSRDRDRDGKIGAAPHSQQQPQNQNLNRPSSGRPLPPPPPHPHPHPHPHPQSRAPPPPLPARPRFEPVDREKTCPLLLRVFTKNGSHHGEEDFAVRGKEPKDEVQIYTWKDATLRELTDLVKEVAPEARRRSAKLSFAFVYPDNRGRFVLRTVGTTLSYGNGRRLDDSKSLGELSFQIGDYLDVAIF
nr:histone deacetylase complex subunit SAP18-like isoform X1 [Quercus suber]XP_023876866.1 histone deacetylase complex subunit SAP18-like isoform X2 [Quercus suber]